MEAEQIGVVLARASELRSKVAFCVHNKANHPDGDAEEEGKSLVHIRDALASLELQLASLQNLQQQQLYERESSVAQIDRSRMILLQKLKEYKGEELELIREAAAFAGETIKQDDDLLLPPYPRDLNDSLVLDDLYSSSFVTKHKSICNGLVSNSTTEAKDSSNDSRKHVRSATTNRWEGLKLVAGFVVKSAVTVLSGIALLSLAGYKTKLGINGIQLKSSERLQNSADGKNLAPKECPPGKLLIMENGDAHCMVKERVEIPFDSIVTSPNLSYGFG